MNYFYFYILKVTKPEDITAESLALFTIMEPPIGTPILSIKTCDPHFSMFFYTISVSFYHLIVSKAVSKMSWHIIHTCRENETKCACDCGLGERSMITEIARFKDLITHKSADLIFERQCIHQVHLMTSDNIIGH